MVVSTMGKLRMAKAMTGRAMPRIRLLKVMYVQTKENDEKEGVPEGVVLASKTGDKVEGCQPQEQQPGAVPHLQQVESSMKMFMKMEMFMKMKIFKKMFKMFMKACGFRMQ